MAPDSPYKVSLQQLAAVQVAREDQVEEHDTSPPAPDAVSVEDRQRMSAVGVLAAGL